MQNFTIVETFRDHKIRVYCPWFLLSWFQ